MSCQGRNREENTAVAVTVGGCQRSRLRSLVVHDKDCQLQMTLMDSSNSADALLGAAVIMLCWALL